MSTWLSKGNSGRSLSRPRLSGSPPRCSWSSRKQLLSKLSHSLRKPSQISPSPLSLLLFPSPYYATALSPPHLFTSPPWCPTSRHALTLSLSLSHSRYPRPRSPYRLSLLLSPLFSFIRRESLVPPSYPRRSAVAAGSSPFTARFRLPLRSDVARMHESKGGGAHARVWERSVGMREEKRPRSYGSARAFSIRSISLSLSPRRAHPFFRSGRQFRERKTRGERRRDRLENESRRNARKEEEEVRRGEGRGEIAWNAAKETQERAIYGAA